MLGALEFVLFSVGLLSIEYCFWFDFEKTRPDLLLSSRGLLDRTVVMRRSITPRVATVLNILTMLQTNLTLQPLLVLANRNRIDDLCNQRVIINRLYPPIKQQANRMGKVFLPNRFKQPLIVTIEAPLNFNRLFTSILGLLE